MGAKSTLESLEIMKFKNKKIFVTGGTGFVGSHLVEELINQEANILTTNIDLDPKSYFLSKKMNKKAKVVNCDIRDFEKLSRIIKKFKPDYIFHLAAQPLVEVALKDPKDTLYSNIMGTINVLESARQFSKSKAIIVASSDKAYGKLSHGKYRETDPLRGDHPYEVSKSATDLISYSYYKTYGLPTVTTRFGNIYGEGDLYFSRIMPGILKAIIKNKTLEIRSNGKYVRDYLYVKDVVRGYLILAKEIRKTKGEAYNFGSDESLSVVALIKLIEKLIGKKINYKILNSAKNEIPYQSLDYSKIKKIGWKHKYSLNDTFRTILNWYEESLKK